jgi:hypothetical protein
MIPSIPVGGSILAQELARTDVAPQRLAFA